MNVNLELAGTSYKDKRAGYYPSIQEQLDLLWHDIDDGKLAKPQKLEIFIRN